MEPDRRRTTRSGPRTPRRRIDDDPDLKAANERAKVGLSLLVDSCRQRVGWSQDSTAAAAGVNRKTVQEMEKGVGDPCLSSIVRTLFVFGFEVHIAIRPVPRPPVITG